MAKETRSTLGKALSRLFSSNIVVRNLGGNQLKIVDPSNIQSVASKYYETKYKGLHSYNEGGRAHRQHQQAPGSNIGYLSERTGLYRDYETMDTDAIISAALDMYADEACAENEYGNVLTIDAGDQEIKDILHNLFYEILDIEFNLRWWVRTLTKYGDCYLKLSISDEYGVVSAEPMSPFEVERMEGTDSDDPYSVTFKHKGFSNQPEYEFWQVAHFRLLSDGNYLPYGKSVLEGARRTWKQLCLHEESRIWTENGYKKIKDVSSEDKVYSFDPESGDLVKTPVRACREMGSQNTYTVATRHREIQATDRHGLLVYNHENEFHYKAVENLEVDNDKLVLPITDCEQRDEYKIKISKDKYSVSLKEVPEYDSNGIIGRLRDIDTIRPTKNLHGFLRASERVPYADFEALRDELNIELGEKNVFYNDSQNKKITNENLKFVVDSDFAKFFGFMLGDGWTNENKIGFCLGNEDISKKYLDYVKNTFNLNYSLSGEEGNRVVHVYSKELRYIFDELGFISGFQNKKVPSWIFSMNLEVKRSFVEGIFDADGSWSEYDAGRLGLSNFELIEGVHILAQQCGIGTGHLGYESEYSNLEETVEYDDCFNKEVTRKPTFRNYLNFSDNYDNDYELQKIKNVELYEENSKTYDLEVENDLHNFVADGVVSHNTLLEDAMLVHRIMRAPEKRIFRIDVGNIEPDAVDTFMDQIVQEINKTPLIDPETGEYNLKYNMQNMIEDYYLPVRGDESGTEIDTLSGLEYQAIEDVEYLRKKMMTALRIPNAFLGYEKELEGKCLHPDTRIELLSGENMRVEDIAEEYETGDREPLWTYSYDFVENRVVPGKIVEAEKTREDAEIVEVVLDNGETVKTTPDHDFILRDGTEVEAQNLEEGDSLRTIERRKKELGNNACEYEQVWQPEEEEWEWTHKMVDRYFNGEIERNGYGKDGRFSYDNLTVVHHEDFDRYNNSPNNLRRMNFKDHRELHQDNIENGLLSEESKRKSKETKQTEEYSQKISKIVKNYLENNPEEKNKLRDVWLSLSSEERSQIVSDGWYEERKKRQAERARKNNRAEQMLKARRENGFESTLEGEEHPRYRERPTFDEIVEFIENYDGDPEDVSTIWDLEDSFGLTKYILQEVIEENGYNCTQFMNEFWGFKNGRPKELHPETFVDLSASCENMEEFVDRIDAYSKRTAKSIVENNGFEFEEWKENILGSRYNHKVAEVNHLEERVDTYNIEVEDNNNNHNFLTDKGLTLKNSTLSQQSIKFANQVKYIQKIVVSELKKIAMVHLFSLGIRDQRLVQFDLSLTSPSTVQESEYLDLLSQKVDLARTITELPLFSTDWIYKKLFNLSDDEIERQRDLKKDDWKRQFQQDQITREGNDPVKTGQSFGTPHDLAQSGSANIKPLTLDKKEKEKKKNKAVKNMQKSKQNKLGGDPLGKDKAFDNSNLRTGDPDYEERYRDRRGLPVDHFLPGKKKDLIKESLSSIEDADTIEEAVENIEAGEGVSKEDLSDYEKGTFMDESVLDHSV